MSLPGLFLAVSTLSAADAKVPDASGSNTNFPAAAAPELTPEQMHEGGTNTYAGWIEFGGGGVITSGNKAEFRKRRPTSGSVFGGIEDFHYQGEVSKDTTLAIDGHSIFDDKNYKLSFDLQREKLGYIKLNVSEFRTWSDGDGGFDPGSGAYYSLSKNALGMDRGEISFEGGLTLEKAPKVTFKYTHAFRDGEKDSTSWGIVHPAGNTVLLSPSFYDIKENSDAFQLDVAGKIMKTDVGGGVRYEIGKLDDTRKIGQSLGEPSERKITDQQSSSYDMFSAHAFTETWIKKNLLFSSGYLYSTLDNDFSGSRIYGADFEVGYQPNRTNNLGYIGLNGGSRLHEYVMDLNLLYKPTDHFSIIPSVRVQKEVSDANSDGLGTLADYSPSAFTADSDRHLIDVRERLDLRYNGITNWVFWGRGELTEGSGNLRELGGVGQVNGIGIPSIDRRTEDDRLFQKYSLGARWYPLRIVTVDGGGYYKHNDFDYSRVFDSTSNDPASFNRYPAYLVTQDFDTYDGNFRLTIRPRPDLTLVSRYEYQLSTIHTRPDSISTLPEMETSTMTSHIIAQDVSWSPWSRLYLQAGVNYVLSDVKTPASDIVSAILKAQNNYWTLNFSSGLVLDKKTDLNLAYFYYLADNYVNNSSYGVPYGSGAEEHGVTATIVRRITSNIRLKLRYGFFHYTDNTFGGYRDYDAHTIMSSLQYRF